MKPKTSLLKSVILIYIFMCIVLFVKDVFADNIASIQTSIDAGLIYVTSEFQSF